MPCVLERYAEPPRDRHLPVWGLRPIVGLAGWLAVAASLFGAGPPSPNQLGTPETRGAGGGHGRRGVAVGEDQEGTPTDGAIDVEHGTMARFQVDVPADAVAMAVCVTRSPLVLEILRPERRFAGVDGRRGVSHLGRFLRPELSSRGRAAPRLETGVFSIACGGFHRRDAGGDSHGAGQVGAFHGVGLLPAGQR